MTLNCYKFEFSRNFAWFRRFGRQLQRQNEWRSTRTVTWWTSQPSIWECKVYCKRFLTLNNKHLAFCMDIEKRCICVKFRSVWKIQRVFNKGFMYCLLAIQYNCVSDKQTYYAIMRYAKQCTITVLLHAYNYPDQGRSTMLLHRVSSSLTSSTW